MKKLLLLLPLFLLLPASAAAKSPIPSLEATEAYKKLSAYVVTLQGISEATADQKKNYTGRLATLKQRADTQVISLFDRRNKRTRDNYDKVLDKRLNSVRQDFRSRARKIDRETEKQRNRASRDFRKVRTGIEKKYSGKLNPLRKRVARLRNQASQADDPREESLLLEEINLLQRKIQRISSSLNSEVDSARDALRRNLRAINASAKKKKAALASQEKGELKTVRKSWKAEKAKALSALQTRRKKESQTVRRLNNQGTAAIAAMTVIVTTGE